MSTPTRKYLCAAPRPGDWSQLEDKVLGRMGPNAREILESTLDQLRTKYNWNTKTGPGRKSNAEHAIYFYEYLLDKVTKEGAKGSDDEEEDDEDEEAEDKKPKASPSVDEDEETESENEEGDEAEGKIKPVEKTEADSAAEEKPQSASAENEEEDSNEQKQPVCEVCYEEGGETLNCTTCPYIFHLPCVRPVMTEFPKEKDWRCAYCFLSTEPKNSRKRRDSAAAVRLMARLRNGIKRRKAAQAVQTNIQSGLAKKKLAGEEKKGALKSSQGKTSSVTTRSDPKAAEPDEAQTDEKPKAKEKSSNQSAAEEPDEEEKQDEVISKKPQDEADKKVVSEEKEMNTTEDEQDDRDDETDTETAAGSTEDEGEASADEDGDAEDAEEAGDASLDGTSEGPGDEEDEGRNLPKTKAGSRHLSTTKDLPKRDDAEACEARKDSGTQSGEPEDTIVSREKSLDEGAGEEMKDQEEDSAQDINENKAESEESTRPKRNLELSKLANTWTGQVDSPEEAGRGKRSRKQPTLYDPQLVPARNWQSDEVDQQDEDGSEDDEKEEPEKVKEVEPEEKTQPEEESADARAARKTVDGELRCAFCGDDPGIPICCFCGCRKCFGKGDHEKVLLCDECDDEYHIYCLEPPLTSIPSVKQWFCPSCTAAKKKTVVIKSSPRTQAKKKVGRPPSVKRPGPGRPPKSEKTEKTAPTGRKRGRPPKNASSPAAAKKGTGRKRGRPPKNKSAPTSSPPPAAPPSPSSPSKKRSKAPCRSADGRFMSPPRTRPISKRLAATELKKSAEPKKLVDLKKPAEPKKSVEGKKQTEKAPALGAAASDAPMAGAPVVVSRSGRTVKRSSFHDEIDEGEQHLKSSKQAPETGPPKKVARTGPLKAPPSQRAAATKHAPASKTEIDLEEDIAADYDMEMELVDLVDPSNGGSVSVDTQTESQEVPVASSRQAGLPKVIEATASSKETSKQMAVVDSAPASPVARKATAPSLPPAQFDMPGIESIPPLVASAASAAVPSEADASQVRVPRRKPGARECMQISRRFGVRVIPDKYIEILTDYCKRGKVEHLIRMRERLDEHSRYLEAQLAGLEALIKTKGESNVVVPALPEGPDRKLERTIAGGMFDD